MSRPKRYENINAYIDKWQKEHYATALIKLPKEEVARIRAYAAYFGPNISRFVFFACEDRANLIRDKMSDEEKAEMDKFIEDFSSDYLEKQKEKNKDKKSE